MRLVLVLWLAAAVTWSCGSSCQAACDCASSAAPVKCPGEWVCGAQKTCEYACKTTCAAGSVFTCRSEEACNGSICSERTACPTK